MCSSDLEMQWAGNQSSFSLFLNQNDVLLVGQAESLQIEDMSGEDGVISGIRCLKFAERENNRENTCRTRSTSPLPRKFVRSPGAKCPKPESNLEIPEISVVEGAAQAGVKSWKVTENSSCSPCSIFDNHLISKQSHFPASDPCQSGLMAVHIREVSFPCIDIELRQFQILMFIFRCSMMQPQKKLASSNHLSCNCSCKSQSTTWTQTIVILSAPPAS